MARSRRLPLAVLAAVVLALAAGPTGVGAHTSGDSTAAGAEVVVADRGQAHLRTAVSRQVADELTVVALAVLAALAGVGAAGPGFTPRRPSRPPRPFLARATARRRAPPAFQPA